MKNNGTLNIIPGFGNLFVYYEPLATINNPSAVPVVLNPCSAITFPIVNCTATGIKENNLNTAFEIYPNPANEILNINIHPDLVSKIRILNNLNQTIKADIKNNSVNIRDLPEGIYFLSLEYNNYRTVCEKFVISR